MRLSIKWYVNDLNDMSVVMDFCFGKNTGKNFGKNKILQYSKKYSQKFLDHPQKSTRDAIKTVSKKRIQIKLVALYVNNEHTFIAMEWMYSKKIKELKGNKNTV